jgi:hypothetical protein
MIQALAKDREPVVVFDCRIRRPPWVLLRIGSGVERREAAPVTPSPGLLCFSAASSTQKKKPPGDEAERLKYLTVGKQPAMQDGQRLNTMP